MTTRALLLGDASSPNVRSLVDGLREAGVETKIASFEAGADVRLRDLGPGASRYVLQAFATRRLAARDAPDLVIGYFASGYGTLASLAGRRPLALIVAGSDLLSEQNGALTRAMVRHNLRAADLVIAWSDELADEASRIGADPRCVLSCPRGVDLDQFHPPHEPPDHSTIISTRSLQSKYRHDVILRALSAIDESWKYTIIGDGADSARVAVLSQELGERVRLAGAMAPADLARALQRHSIYVSACVTDGVSASLLEAMATGLLPVVVDNPSNRPWIDPGVNGLLHDGSAAGLAQALRIALHDEDLRSRALEMNRALVADRGDRRKNMTTIADRLRSLVTS